MTSKLKPAFINFIIVLQFVILFWTKEITLKNKKTVSAPKCQFSPAGLSLIQQQQPQQQQQF